MATLHRDGGWGYVNAAAEAAMVGALADWFAVTALFRRPLGLPIPHTAIVPTRKDSLAESLEQFVTENFLSEEVVAEKMRTAEVSRRAGEWLAAGNHAERIVAEGARTIGAALPRLGDDDVTAFVRGSLLPRFVRGAAEPDRRALPAVGGRGRRAPRAVRPGHGRGVRLAAGQPGRWSPTWSVRGRRAGRRSGWTGS